MWDLIVSVPDHCLSFYFGQKVKTHSKETIKLAVQPDICCSVDMRN